MIEYFKIVLSFFKNKSMYLKKLLFFSKYVLLFLCISFLLV